MFQQALEIRHPRGVPSLAEQHERKRTRQTRLSVEDHRSELRDRILRPSEDVVCQHPDFMAQWFPMLCSW